MKKYLLISLIILSGVDKPLMADMDTDGIVEHNATRFIKYCLKDWFIISKITFTWFFFKNMNLIQQEIHDNLNIFNNIQDLCDGIQDIQKAIKKTGMKLDNEINSIELLANKPLDEFIFYKVNLANALINKEVVDLQKNIASIQKLKKMKQEESKKRMYVE